MWLVNSHPSNYKFGALPEILKRPQQTPHPASVEFSPSPPKQEPEQPPKKICMKPKLPNLGNLKLLPKYQSPVSPKMSQPTLQLKQNIVSTKIQPRASSIASFIPSEPDEKPKISIKKKILIIDQFELKEIIGQGSYAIVRKGIHQITGEIVAIKMYPKERLFDPSRARAVAKEISILRKCQHPNIIKLYKINESNKYINIIMEYGGDQSLKKMKQQKEQDIRKIFYQLLSAIRYLHKRNIMHRDIKLENILINSNKDIKLIDFGFATEFENNHHYSSTYGTPSYMAPEILPPQPKYNEISDIWSCGIVLYILLFGRFPFVGQTEKELQGKIKNQYINVNHDNMYIQEVLEMCLERNPEIRKCADNILKTLWLNYYD